MSDQVNSLNNARLDQFKRLYLQPEPIHEVNRLWSMDLRRNKKYSPEEIARIIQEGSLKSKIELSRTFFKNNSFYRRILIYYATILKYVGLLIPQAKGSHKLSEKSLQKAYTNTLDFIDSYDIYNFCVDKILTALRDGCYYGLVLEATRKELVVMDLPAEYCSSIYVDKEGFDLIRFDLSYFEGIKTEEERTTLLKSFPNFIVSAYKRYKKDGNRYIVIPSDLGVCFPFYEGVPNFINMIPATLEYEDAKQMERDAKEEDIHKILIQRIPHLNDGTLLFEPPEAQTFHTGAVKMLSSNKHTSVLTTYADTSVESPRVNENDNNLIEIAVNNIFEEAGVSKQMFSSDSNLTLVMSIKNDVNLMLPIVNKISRFFTKIINMNFGKTNIDFKYTILPISSYLEEDYLKNTSNMATLGYSFILPALAMGMSQTDLVNIKTLENDVLHLDEVLKPLSSSFNQTEQKEDEGGRPQKEDVNKSPKTEKNLEAQE